MKFLPLFLIGSAAPSAAAQTTASTAAPASSGNAMTSGPEVSFQFERYWLAGSQEFTLVVHEDGTGTYQAQLAAVSGGSGAAPASSGAPINRPIRIKLSHDRGPSSKWRRTLDRFNLECASKAKNIADTGKKGLTYKGADGQGSCLYNYSENKGVAQLAELFQAIAFADG